MTYPAKIRIFEVGPRDGLQNEATTVSPASKIALIEALAAAGARNIEAGSFVSPKAVPRMADTEAVLTGLTCSPDVNCAVLVPNARGLERAREAGAREIAVFAAATEAFSRRNLNSTIDESLERYRGVVRQALDAGIRVRGYVSCVLGCPYEGDVAPFAVAHVAEALVAMGCYEVSLGDTIGVGTPLATRGLIEHVARAVPVGRLALHCHDTYGQALANILACLDLGIATIDSAVAGLGGCPYAPGATGNVATEDLVFMLDGMGIDAGIDLAALARAGWTIARALGREPASRVARALAASGRLSEGPQ